MIDAIFVLLRRFASCEEGLSIGVQPHYAANDADLENADPAVGLAGDDIDISSGGVRAGEVVIQASAVNHITALGGLDGESLWL